MLFSEIALATTCHHDVTLHAVLNLPHPVKPPVVTRYPTFKTEVEYGFSNQSVTKPFQLD